MNSPSRVFLSVFILAMLLGFCAPVAAYSDRAVGWYEQGNATLASGNLTAAIDDFDRALEIEPAYYEALNARADALNRDGQFSMAEALATQALTINPEYVPGWINKGQILYNIGYYYEDQMKDMTKANEYYNQQLLAFDKAITLDPNNADAWFNKGYALAGMKRYDEAIAAFEKVQALNPDYPKIAKNKQIAEKLRDAAAPDYVKYAPVLAGIAILLIGIGIWYVFLREKEK
jgi:tetratricopeptide (TPR) repeat protein